MGATVCIGGLIATGKTTFLERLTRHCKVRGVRYHFMAELYNDGLRKMVSNNLSAGDGFIYGHRMQMAFDAPLIAQSYDLVLMERSFIDHLAFYESFVEMGIMPLGHLETVKQATAEFAPPIPDRFVYLDISPELASSRKLKRNHGGDDIFSLDFLRSLRKNSLRIISEYYTDPLILDWTNFGQDLCLDSFLENFTAEIVV